MLIQIFPDRIQLERRTIQLPLKRGEEQLLELAIKNHGPPVHLALEIPEPFKDRIILPQSGLYVRSEELIPISIRLPKSSQPGFSTELKISTSSGLSSKLELRVGERIPWSGIKLEPRSWLILGWLGAAGGSLGLGWFYDHPGLIFAACILISMLLVLGINLWFNRILRSSKG